LSIETALSSGGIDSSESEIAFFGGSFTAINREYMIDLLSAANDYLDKFKGIRISTRPDCISKEVLNILKKYGVTSIELGAQSMDDKVLMLNNRGHNSDCVRNASALIKDSGFSLGLQMMTGLYGSSAERDKYTANEFIKLSPDTVRIYPTVVLKDTYLAYLYDEGVYSVHNAYEAAELCSELIPQFENAGIKIIRVGLHSSETLEKNIIAGGYHPAFRELCENIIFLNIIKESIYKQKLKQGNLNVFVAPDSVSKAIGQGRRNVEILKEMGYMPKFIPDNKLRNRQIIIQEG